MIESRSESSLLPPLKIRGAGGVMKLEPRIRGGEENGAWPGQRGIAKSKALNLNRFRGLRISVRTNGQPDNEAGLKFGFTEEKCFQCLKPGVVDLGESEDKLDTYKRRK